MTADRFTAEQRAEVAAILEVEQAAVLAFEEAVLGLLPYINTKEAGLPKPETPEARERRLRATINATDALLKHLAGVAAREELVSFLPRLPADLKRLRTNAEWQLLAAIGNRVDGQNRKRRSERFEIMWGEIFQKWEDRFGEVGMTEGDGAKAGPLERLVQIVHEAAGWEPPSHQTLKGAAREFRRGTFFGGPMKRG